MRNKILVGIILLVLLTIGCTQKPTIQGCEKPKTEECVKATAEKFARVWEQKDYDSMYKMFIPELQNMKNKDNFKKTLQFEEKENDVVVRLDKISKESDTIAYAYYTISSSLFDSKAPAMKMVYTDGDWEIDAFATYFSKDMFQAEYLVLQSSDLPAGYIQTDRHEVSATEGSSEIVENNAKNELKSKYFIEYKYGGTEFTELVSVYSNEGIIRQWNFEKEDYQKAMGYKSEYLDYAYFDVPVIGDEIIGIKGTVITPSYSVEEHKFIKKYE